MRNTIKINTIYILIFLQFIASIIMAKFLNKWTLLLLFLVTTGILIYVIIKQKSKPVTILFSICILILFMFYFYTITDETFPR